MSLIFQRSKESKKVFLSPDYNQEKFSHVLHSFSEVDPFVHFALDAALELIHAHAGSLFIWDEFSKELVLKSFQNPSVSRIRDVRIKLNEGICGLVAKKGEGLLVEDIRHDSRLQAVECPGRYQTFSFLCIPLLSNHKLLGVLNITEKENQTPFTHEEWKQAELFARHIALAYDNLKLRHRLQSENASLREELTMLKETLPNQEKFVSIGKVASHLAHELSNPIDAIRRFLNLALDQVMEDSLARTYLLKAKDGIRHSLRVIRGLLALCREPIPNQTKAAELHELINQSVNAFVQHIPADAVLVEKHFCGEKILVRDCGLQLVFKNLFENAYHAVYINGNGSAKAHEGKLLVDTKRKNGHVIVSVKDNGSGIPESIRPRIFDPFFTTKKEGEGNGIGLAICRDIIERCGGQIVLGNCEEGGTEFTITLPVQEKEAGL
ncbi:MAG: GAF domain-containing sensor histidine kinase [Candidatus Omnitrophica bacterium]|nr:GAF domain-containing sensor histidine kinase [Candidatus Omnitrophota bacterium]